MSRKGLIKDIQVSTDPSALQRFVVNVRDAVQTLADDHDILSVPVAAYQGTAQIASARSVVVYQGASGQSLTLPLAKALGAATSAMVAILNTSKSAVRLVAVAGDLINGAASTSIPSGSSLVLVSDGVSKWISAGSTMTTINDPTVTTIAAAVKAASTGALATDPALVVSVSPNSPIPGRAATANPASTAGGSPVPLMADKAGRLVTTPVHARELVAVQQTAIAVNTETTIITAGGAGVFNDLLWILVTTAVATAGTLTIKDATGGTTRFVINYPDAGLAPGGVLFLAFPVPVPQAAAAANWTLTNSQAVAINVTCGYAKNL